jgi:hypothetical protein
MNDSPAIQTFRFFDFDVEPGKRYVYRVCLAPANQIGVAGDVAERLKVVQD